MKKESKKASRLTLAKETIASMRVRSGVATGMGIGDGGVVGGGGGVLEGGLISFPANTCVTKIKSLCPDPPPPKPTTSALCF